VFHISILGTCSFLGGWAHQSTRGYGTGYQATDVYFENCITKPCQLGLRPFGCSAVITTSYIRRLLRWTTLFSTPTAKLYNHFD